MKNHRIRILLVCLLIFSLTASPIRSRAEALSALWTAHFSDPYFMGTSMTSTPVVTDDAVYVVNKDTLYALETKDGKVLWELRLAARMNSVCDPVLDEENLYIPLSDGILQCVDIRTHAVRWTGEPHLPPGEKSAQTLGRLRLLGGILYAGTWCAKMRSSGGLTDIDRDVSSDGVFFGIDPTDGHTIWSYRNDAAPAGFYWSQAALLQNRIFFTSEDGLLISYDPTAGTVRETTSLTDGKQLRCGLCADENHNCLYAVSKNGILLCTRLSSDGNVDRVDRIPLLPEARSTTFTSTPSLYRDTLYIGGSADGSAVLIAMNTNTGETRFVAKSKITGDIKSHPLVIPSDADPSVRTICFTINEKSGAAYYLLDSDDAHTGNIQTLFTPRKDKQYCLADMVRGPDGTLYYSNDSGTLFALGKIFISADDPSNVKKKKGKALRRLLVWFNTTLITLYMNTIIT